MDFKKIIFNIMNVSIGHGFKLLMGLAIGFLLPLVLTIEDFGYYRLFALYLSYVGVVHLGFVDGIYLSYVGDNLDDIKKKGFADTASIFVINQVLFTVVFILLVTLFSSSERRYIFIMLAINILPLNLTSLLQYVSQITERFREFSNRNIIYSSLIIVIIIIMYFLNIENYNFYVLWFTVINYFVAGWYVFSYRHIFSLRPKFGKAQFSDYFRLTRVGIPLLITNLIVILILNIPKQIVDFYFDIEDFAQFTFSFGLLSVISLFIGAIGTVMYPTLHSINKGLLSKNYQIFNGLVYSFASLFLLSFFPIRMIVDNYLTKYSNTLVILAIIFPIALFSSSINIVKSNYFKLFNKMREFLFASLITALISLVGGILAYYLFKSTSSIAYVSLISFAIWGLILDILISKQAKISLVRNSAYTVFITSIFLASLKLSSNLLVSFSVFLISWIISSLLIYFNEYKQAYKLLILERTKK